MARLTEEELVRSRDVWRDHNRVQGAAALSLGIDRNTLYSRLNRAAFNGLLNDDDLAVLKNPDRQRRFVAAADTTKPKPAKEDDRPLTGGRIEVFGRTKATLKPGTTTRFILTSAQNNTPVHPAVWDNLMALARRYGAEVMVSRFTYNKAAWRRAEKPGAQGAVDDEGLWYDPVILPYVVDHRIELAPGLDFCGEQNTIPTAKRPLQGFESYTGRASGIFPHAKFAMQSIASSKHEGTKINWTTGTVTQRNYIQKRAGLEAEFHHGYGGLLVEVDKDGDWFVRQLNADSDGTIHDLTLRAKDGKVTDGHRVEAINWGDVHTEKLDPEVREVCWSNGGIIDVLRPRYQFMHDLIDFAARNHHNRGDGHHLFKMFVDRAERIEGAMANTALFLAEAHRRGTETLVVESNHDNALTRWLKEGDYRGDPVNALFFLRAQTAMYEALAEGREREFNVLEWALRQSPIRLPKALRFLREDDSFVICPDAGGGIECGMHGHLGPDGSRGNPRAFARMGRKANTGHTHSAGIVDGVYTAGVSGKLDMGYNRGPSSWSHSHVITYPNGKRAIVTVWNGKWRA